MLRTELMTYYSGAYQRNVRERYFLGKLSRMTNDGIIFIDSSTSMVKLNSHKKAKDSISQLSALDVCIKKEDIEDELDE